MENSKREVTQQEANELSEKRIIVESWEEVFERKISTIINPEGIRYIYSLSTTVKEVVALLLDAEKISEAVAMAKGKGDVKVIVSNSIEDAIEKLNDEMSSQDDERPRKKVSGKFVVQYKTDVIGGAFKLFDDANKYAIKYALEHGIPRSELQILESLGNPTLA